MKTRFQLTRITTLLFYIAMLCVIQGFKSKHVVATFPSPLENTIIAFYYDFSTTGIYKNNLIASEPISILNTKVQKFNPNVSAEQTANFLSDLFSQANFKPEQLYFYMSKDNSFVLAIHGEFPWKRWKETYPSNTIVNRADGFSLSVPAIFIEDQRMSINISSNMLVICPENIAGNVMSSIYSNSNQKKISFPVFQKMILQKPVVAFETSVKELMRTTKESLTRIELPTFIKRISHLRFIAHRKISKLQFSVKSDAERIETSNIVKTSLDDYISGLSTITTKIKNTSVYISAKPSEEISTKIGYDLGGLFLHFITKINNQNSIVLSKNEKGSKTNDNIAFSNEQKTNKKLSKSNNN